MSDLDKKSVTELRGMVQALGYKLDWGWDKAALIKRITTKITPPSVLPIKSDVPSDQRLRTVPPARNLPQRQVHEALVPLIQQGLVVTYPSLDTVQFTYQTGKGPRIDSCSLRVPLRVILQAAKAVLNG